MSRTKTLPSLIRCTGNFFSLISKSSLRVSLSCVNGSVRVVLLGLEVDHDPKSPKFGASQKDSLAGLWIDWALEETGLCKGDR